MYSGQIEGIGPRYCPSIEDKIVKFPDKTQHQFFLEPEGLNTHEVYVNGMSTSLPMEVQWQMVHSIPGLETGRDAAPRLCHRVRLRRRHRTRPHLRVKCMAAFISPARSTEPAVTKKPHARASWPASTPRSWLKGEPPFTMDRTEGYTGILIDDLICKGTNEPYRMFTSRAEFRLHLRIDNADRRLTPHGRRLGLINDDAWHEHLTKQQRMEELRTVLEKTRVRTSELPAELAEKFGNVDGSTIAQLLKRPESEITLFSEIIRRVHPSFFERGSSDREFASDMRNELKSVETEIKYAGYLDQQTKAIDRLKRAEQRLIPEWFDYASVSGLSREMREKMQRVRPRTIGQASRIPGVTPAAVSLINVYIEIQGRKLQRNSAG